VSQNAWCFECITAHQNGGPWNARHAKIPRQHCVIRSVSNALCEKYRCRQIDIAPPITTIVRGPIINATARDGTCPEKMLLAIRYSGNPKHIVLYDAGQMCWITAAVPINTQKAEHMPRLYSRTTENDFLHIMSENIK